MQNDFCTEGGWLHSRGIDISPNRKPIKPLQKLIGAFREHGIPVIWVNWGVRKDLAEHQPFVAARPQPKGR